MWGGVQRGSLRIDRRKSNLLGDFAFRNFFLNNHSQHGKHKSRANRLT